MLVYIKHLWADNEWGNTTAEVVFSRCVNDLYMNIVSDGEKYIPTMENLYNRLLEQEDKEARDVAFGLEIFVDGVLNIFMY